MVMDQIQFIANGAFPIIPQGETYPVPLIIIMAFHGSTSDLVLCVCLF